ncbi:MAG TPA: hypothetical protein EYP34_12750 [Chromatiaceae bacterium]|nr:hypothetical protein [Chromatiaceae bacterium]
MIRDDWLDRYAPGLQALTQEERDAITNFAFLWTMFEAKVLGAHASANGIAEAARRWADNGLLALDTFEQEIAYFRDRYVMDGQFTYHFNQLHLRRNDEPALVKKVLAEKDSAPDEIAAVVLIIVYRYRNNRLFPNLSG